MDTSQETIKLLLADAKGESVRMLPDVFVREKTLEDIITGKHASGLALMQYQISRRGIGQGHVQE